MAAITETLQDILDFLDPDLNFQAQDIEDYLIENGFMIVPIEDPTNLRFGVE